MRLLLKATLFYLIITMIVFGIGGVMTYDIFQRKVEIDTDLYLRGRLWNLEKSLKNGESASSFISRNTSILEVDNSIPETKYMIGDTLADHPNPRIDKMEPHRKIRAVRKIEDKTYKIEIFDVIVESDDIFSGVFESQTRLFVILGVVLMIFSFLVSTWLFRPFNITLYAIKNFRLNDSKKLKLGKTNTKEFRELNNILSDMIEKNRNDYKNLKEFSENASHEMQTPLAVAKGKMELLLQSKNLDKEQLQLIHSSYEAIDHLSKMGRSLGLLTKIENKEFTDYQEIDLSEKITTAIFDFQELLELKEIKIDHQVDENIRVKSDPSLLHMLIANLFQNAIRHNIANGEIHVVLTKSSLKISNTGNPLSGSSEALFKRFKKDNQSGETIGLGLSIVREICEVNGYDITYNYENSFHQIEILF